MDKVYNIDDINNLTEGELRDIFNDIEVANHQSEIINKLEVKKDICVNCNKKDTIVDDTIQGFMVCTNCGQVIDSIIDSNLEWRQYDDKNDTSRCSMGINKLLPQSSLGTTISGGAYKSRLKTLHGWSIMPYKERSLNIVFKDIQSKCAQAGIIKCIEDDAKIMYKSINDCKHISGKNMGKYIIIRGANRRSLIAACVFFACKKKNMTRSPKEISDLFNLKYTEMTRGCKNFTKLIKLRKMEINLGMSFPEHFVIRFCNALKIKNEYIEEVIRIANNINRLGIATEHTPISIATGSILLMADNNKQTFISKKKIATQFNISEVTITKIYKKIWQFRHIINNNDIVDKIIKENTFENDNSIIPENVKIRMKKFGIIYDDELINSDKILIENLDNDNLDRILKNNLDDINNKLIMHNLNYMNICKSYYSN